MQRHLHGEALVDDHHPRSGGEADPPPRLDGVLRISEEALDAERRRDSEEAQFDLAARLVRTAIGHRLDWPEMSFQWIRYSSRRISCQIRGV